jgi:hypothetical protein
VNERAEGFWWVRLLPTLRSEGLGFEGPPGTWRTLWFFGDSLMSHDPRDGGTFIAMREQVMEWGPYLGTGPETTLESIDRKIADLMAVRLPSFGGAPGAVGVVTVIDPDDVLRREERAKERERIADWHGARAVRARGACGRRVEEAHMSDDTFEWHDGEATWRGYTLETSSEYYGLERDWWSVSIYDSVGRHIFVGDKSWPMFSEAEAMEVGEAIVIGLEKRKRT